MTDIGKITLTCLGILLTSAWAGIHWGFGAGLLGFAAGLVVLLLALAAMMMAEDAGSAEIEGLDEAPDLGSNVVPIRRQEQPPCQTASTAASPSV